jgi:tRNA C32,U32 (ribose-2'-O)-methylase TrmJ
MIEKPSSFNANDNYTSLKAARKANKNWFKLIKQYYYEQYKTQIKDPSLTAEQRSHIFDHYQENLDACQRQYKQNNANIKFHFADVKTKVSKDTHHKTLTSKKSGNA